MKTTSTIILYVCIIATVLFSQQSVNAQVACNSPRLQFSNPTLSSGTALSTGAIYKFPNVMAGVDCFIKVTGMYGGAYLVAMETPGQGYPDAWQPIIGGPGAPNLNRSWISFEVSFKTTAGANYGFPCLDVSAIDVDGDGGKIGEFIEADGHTSFTIPTPTLLTVTDLGAGKIRAQGPVTNRPSIDTSAMDVRASFYYNGRDKIELNLGSFVYNNGYTGGVARERLNCVYFSKIVGSYLVLPVNFLSFDATAGDKKVMLNWETENEVNNNHFEVERSFDNNSFKTIGLVMDAINVTENGKGYKYMDNSAELKSQKIVYYRLKQIDHDSRFTYSKVIAVKLQTENKVSMQAGPNPFIDKINIGFDAGTNGTAEIRVTNIAGKTVMVKKYNLSNGYNNLQLNGLGTLSSGMYMVQVYVNGIAMSTQKMIKN